MNLLYDGSIGKKLWLEQIANKYGDFKIAFSKKVNGEHVYYKHRSVIECSSDENLYYMFDICNHRQILPYEIIIDLDDEKAIADVDKICNRLDGHKEEFICYKTGSKGFHIHIIEKKLAIIRNNYKNHSEDFFKLIHNEIYKLLIQKQLKIFVDTQKGSNKTLIAFENVPHWKTGIKKIIYRKGIYNGRNN